MLSIGDYVRISIWDSLEDSVGYKWGYLEDVLKSHRTYDEETILKYYGKSYPLGALRPQKVDRLVVKVEGGYIIVPEGSFYVRVQRA